MHKIFAFLAIVFTAHVGISQPVTEDQKNQTDKIEALKIAFITNELDLSEDEAEAFWPVYNQMTEDMQKARKEQRDLTRKMRDNFEVMSDEEVEKTTTLLLDNDIKQSQLKKDYTQKIAGIIGYRKATKLLSVEQRFKRELLQRLNRPDKEDDQVLQKNENQN